MKRIIKRLSKKKVTSTNFFLFLLALLSISVVFDTWAMLLFLVLCIGKECIGAWRERGYDHEF
jgi:hypothetical protein